MGAGLRPHVRRARSQDNEHREERGIIPAYAGSTCSRTHGTSRSQDHPCMRGEHKPCGTITMTPKGSSPHVRGARGEAEAVQLRGGIIPACAGSTSTSNRRLYPTTDHPRMCGEHRKMYSDSKIVSGSSPHVRGAHRAPVLLGRVLGIIPACAGSTAGAATCPPRASGSSPHVRGARVHREGERVEFGIIPACAGSTSRT